MHRIFELSNGIRVVTEYMNYAKTVSAGLWVYSGSTLENIENNGISHFIEHMLFKGTYDRTAKEIAYCMDVVGGRLNAVTSKEYTCYYTKTLAEHLEIALELLGDMVVNSKFAEDDIEMERKVIAEEINMGEDDPEELIYDIACDAMWPAESLGFSVAGTLKSVENIKRQDMLKYFEERYCAENIVISIAGNFDEGKLEALLEKLFGGIASKGKIVREQKKIIHTRSIKIVKKDTEQCQLCIGFEGVPRVDSRDCGLAIMNALFGGNMSSRLFQKVREEQGLAYSVYSDVSAHINNGSLCVWAGLNPENLTKTIDIISKEIKVLKDKGFSADEVEAAKTQLKASIVIDDESISSREGSNGKGLLLDGKVRTSEEILDCIERVTPTDVAEIVEQVFDADKMTIAVLGRVKEKAQHLDAVAEF